MAIKGDVQTLDLGAVVDMYVLDLTVIGGVDIFHFHPGVNKLEQNVVWQGVEYTRWPMTAEGYELSGKGVLPRPQITVANLDGSISALCRAYQDMVGAKLTRKRTLAKYLDAVNFPGGVNATADTNQHFSDEIYFVERKAYQDDVFIRFELTARWDVAGVKLPRRQVVQNSCPFIYRGAECSYAGAAMFDLDDMPTVDPDEDKCSKRLSGCRVRFGTTADLPYGAFPLVITT